MAKEIELEFSKIVGEGKTLGRFGGKVVFAYGVLPGEKARIRVTKEKKNFMEGDVTDILLKSPHRKDPQEEHYLNCSPWQIMDYSLQAATKKNLIEDLLYQTLKENIKLDSFHQAKDRYGYRTKIEYSFTEKDGRLAFAFHRRGAYYEKIVLPTGCSLISENANTAALKILEKLNSAGVKKELLKTLIIRKAANTGDVIACLYSRTENLDISCSDIKELKGFLLIYSNPVSSTSTVDRILKTEGLDYVSEKIGGLYFDYGFDCFFQNNIDLFEEALSKIKNSTANLGRTLDLYSGVGVIGLCMKGRFESLVSVEFSPSAARYARINAEKNGLSNCEVICSSGEKAEKEIFTGLNTIILDPPRAGLHKNVVKNIMESLPDRIIYLSCNPITQGRDALFFLEKYRITMAAGFDFYPNTPHVENLLIFEKK